MHRHLDPSEAQEVVRLASLREAAHADGPTIEGLAEALGLPVSEVERLLAQVRAKNEPTSRRTFGDRSAALSAALVLALVLVVGAIGAGAFMMVRPNPAPAVNGGFHMTGPDGSRIDVEENGAVVQGPVLAPPAPPDTTITMDSSQAERLVKQHLEEAEARLREAGSNRAEIQAQIEALKAQIDQLQANVRKESGG